MYNHWLLLYIMLLMHNILVIKSVAIVPLFGACYMQCCKNYTVNIHLGLYMAKKKWWHWAIDSLMRLLLKSDRWWSCILIKVTVDVSHNANNDCGDEAFFWNLIYVSTSDLYHKFCPVNYSLMHYCTYCMYVRLYTVNQETLA